MQDALSDLLKRRRDRAIAIVLSIKERECDSHLPREARAKLRKVVLDQFNDFFDVAIDILASLSDGSVTINEVYLEKIDEIHTSIVRGEGLHAVRLAEAAEALLPPRSLDGRAHQRVQGVHQRGSGSVPEGAP